MDSQIEQITPVECRVRVTIPWSDVGPRLTGKLNDLRRKARVPGFRTGKVPVKTIERMYGKGLREELARDLVQETFQTAVAEHKTNPLTQPVLESSKLEKGTDFEYSARFEIAPKIEPKDYKGVEVRRRPAVVDEDKVTAAIEKKREELTEIRPIEPAEGEDAREATRPGDIWTADIDGKIGDDRVSRKDIQVEIGKDSGEVVPGLAAALADLPLSAVGQARDITFIPPEDKVKADYRGREVTLKVALREVREKVVPELDDEFARDTGDAESLDELTEKIRGDIRQEDQDTAEREARQRLVEALLELNSFDPAPSMIAREVQAQVQMFKRQLAQQGMTLQQLGSNDGAMGENMRPQATFNVKAFLLLEAIRGAEDIDVSEDEVDAEIKEMAESQGQNPQRLRATMEKNQQLLLLRAQMREERVLDFLMGEAKVTEAPDPEPEKDDSDAEAPQEAETAES